MRIGQQSPLIIDIYGPPGNCIPGLFDDIARRVVWPPGGNHVTVGVDADRAVAAGARSAAYLVAKRQFGIVAHGRIPQ